MSDAESYWPDQHCGECGVVLDATTTPADHEPLCPHHADARPDLDELAGIESQMERIRTHLALRLWKGAA